MIIASPPLIPVNCFAGLLSSTGAEKANFTPLRLNSTRTRIMVAIAVAISMYTSKPLIWSISSPKMLENVFQFAILKVRPHVNAIRKMQAALIAGTPTEMRIGNTIDPTMMIEPSPLSVVNRTAQATTIIRVTTRGLSPPSSALFLMMFSVTPVLFISCPSHAPKITAMIALPIRTVPASSTV